MDGLAKVVFKVRIFDAGEASANHGPFRLAVSQFRRIWEQTHTDEGEELPFEFEFVRSQVRIIAFSFFLLILSHVCHSGLSKTHPKGPCGVAR
jgi:hypothetical protein